jgi:hypothetical protein
MHCYERVHPVNNGTVTQYPTAGVYTAPKSPMHVVVGTAGAMQVDQWTSPLPAWSAARGADALSSYGYGQLTLTNATHLHFQFKAIDGSSGDEFWIVK